MRIGQSDAYAIRDTVVKKWQMAGMNIIGSKFPVMICNPSSPAAVQKALVQSGRDCQAHSKRNPQLVVCIIDKFAPGLYAMIKKLALTELGLITQCMLFKNVRSAEEIKDQYIVNVALKANIKIGGATNHVSAMGRIPSSELNMYIGADVTHASPGSNAPSIAAVVSSVDANAVNYYTCIRAHGHRQEMITQIESIMNELLVNFMKVNQGKAPKKIYFFRDGVASGQFEEVRNVEIRGMLAALHNLKLKIPITFMVVQKRHHIRLFPVDDNADRSGNCLPGTVIDTSIMHPTEFNFILQSHAGIQGTSRGCIYHVLHDDLKHKSDDLQTLCYSLCFLAERATRTISMVAPAYRAHIAAFYARMFLESGEGSSASGEAPPGMMRQVSRGIPAQMYYM